MHPPPFSLPTIYPTGPTAGWNCIAARVVTVLPIKSLVQQSGNLTFAAVLESFAAAAGLHHWGHHDCLLQALYPSAADFVIGILWNQNLYACFRPSGDLVMSDDVRTLRERLLRWCRLAWQISDGQTTEAIRDEIAQLKERIRRLEAKKSDSQSQLDD